MMDEVGMENGETRSREVRLCQLGRPIIICAESVPAYFAQP